MVANKTRVHAKARTGSSYYVTPSTYNEFTASKLTRTFSLPVLKDEDFGVLMS